jgi:hypothetical protein
MRTRKPIVFPLCDDVTFRVAKHQSVTVIVKRPNRPEYVIRTFGQLDHPRGQDVAELYLVVPMSLIEPEPLCLPKRSQR